MKERPESFSRRRRVVRAIEGYLEAHEGEVPSLADLRRVAALQQSTLRIYWVGKDDTLIWVVAPGGRITMTRSASRS